MAAAGDDVDRISDLPDELLHRILVRLRSTAAAARTSSLSRRWRRVWVNVPALFLGGAPTASTFEAVDAALSAASYPWLHLLEVSIRATMPGVPAARASAWLRFASRRLAGELALRLSLKTVGEGVTEQDLQLELPACERATAIDIFLTNVVFLVEGLPIGTYRHPLLRLPVVGTFAALQVLKIGRARLVFEELGHVVSGQSPCLRVLELHGVVCFPRRDDHDLAIRSSSLRRIVLAFLVGTVGRLTIASSSLFYLELTHFHIVSVAIAAPALSELIWNYLYLHNTGAGSIDVSGVNRHLYRLEISSYYHIFSKEALFRQFDTVHELYLSNSVTDVDHYKCFIQETSKLPRAKILQVQGWQADNNDIDTMLHLLRKCDGLRLEKLKIIMRSTVHRHDWCLPMDSWRTNDITLSSLQEIEIRYFKEDEYFYALLDLLFLGCKIRPERLVIYPCRHEPLTWLTRRRIEKLADQYTNVVFKDPI